MLKNEVSIEKTTVLPLGVHMQADSIRFSLRMKNTEEVRLNLYRHHGEKPEFSIVMNEHNSMKWGEVFSVVLRAPDISRQCSEEYEYTYEVDGKEFVDDYARRLSFRHTWGKRKEEELQRGGFSFIEQSWTKSPVIPYDRSIFYQLHVRNFTKHFSSGVEGRGTFAGVNQKLSYLKELGINAIILLPCYEFEEIEGKRLNCWGYVREGNYYFSLKASYALHPEKANEEFAKLVDDAHQMGIQIIMDMHFAGQTQEFIISCLHYYVQTFHVDGFVLNLNAVMKELVWDDPILSQVKLLGTYWDGCGAATDLEQRHLCEYNDGFMNVARQYLKGDEGKINDFYQLFKANSLDSGRINYMTQNNGFTLNDLVTYDIKHNEANGENNRDGTDYNYSWNCGAEGVTKKKTVLHMRRQQQMNALLMIFLSIGSPMIFMGDEFGNSQKGNNNAYCVDGPLTWLNWNQVKTHDDLLDTVKKLIQFRQTQSIYHEKKEFSGSDYLACGYPDVSLHGTEPWTSSFPYYCREMGILFMGKYCEEKDANSVYMAFNMHWELHEFYLPALEKDEHWEVYMDSSRLGTKGECSENSYVLQPRSIVVFVQAKTKARTKSRAKN